MLIASNNFFQLQKSVFRLPQNVGCCCYLFWIYWGHRFSTGDQGQPEESTGVHVWPQVSTGVCWCLWLTSILPHVEDLDPCFCVVVEKGFWLKHSLNLNFQANFNYWSFRPKNIWTTWKIYFIIIHIPFIWYSRDVKLCGLFETTFKIFYRLQRALMNILLINFCQKKQ